MAAGVPLFRCSGLGRDEELRYSAEGARATDDPLWDVVANRIIGDTVEDEMNDYVHGYSDDEAYRLLDQANTLLPSCSATIRFIRRGPKSWRLVAA
jgi:hypothetical protein